MIAFAERHFELNTADHEGVTHRQRIEGLMKRASPQKLASYEAELEMPPFPQALDYLWQAFWRLRARVNASGFGVGRITWPDIDAFCRHSRLSLAPWEVEILERLDDLCVAEASRDRDKE